MQILATHISGRWVIDRSQAQAAGQVTRLFLDPANLKVAYFEIIDLAHDDVVYVRGDQVAVEGEVLTVASTASFGEKEDFLRDQELLETPCLLAGYKVVDRANRHLGRVTNFTISSTTLRVERLHIGVPFWQRLLLPERVVSARSIHEVILKKHLIVINQSLAPAKGRVANPAVA